MTIIILLLDARASPLIFDKSIDIRAWYLLHDEKNALRNSLKKIAISITICFEFCMSRILA